jgi:hypothetical protein
MRKMLGAREALSFTCVNDALANFKDDRRVAKNDGNQGGNVHGEDADHRVHDLLAVCGQYPERQALRVPLVFRVSHLGEHKHLGANTFQLS